MKRFNLFILAVALLTLSGCVEPNPTDYVPLKSEANGVKRSVAQAQQAVEELLGQIDRATRAGGPERKVADYYCCGDDRSTRSEDMPDDELQTYVFNFENDEGFAIVAADTRVLAPVLAVIDKGRMEPGTIIDNPGMITFLILARQYCEDQIRQNTGITPYELTIP